MSFDNFDEQFDKNFRSIISSGKDSNFDPLDAVVYEQIGGVYR